MSGGWWPRVGWTRPERSWAGCTPSKERSWRGAAEGGNWGFPPRTSRRSNELIPPHGVYATIVTIDGVLLGAITNIGTRPTFDETRTTIETHVLGDVGDLYGRSIRVAFIQRLRDERRFEDVDALRTQIDADRQRAERLFARLSV